MRSGLRWLLLLCLVPAVTEAAQQDRHVLLLHSYHPGHRWTDEVTAGVRDGLAAHTEVVLHVEHMDAKQWSWGLHFPKLLELYWFKYGPAGEHAVRLDAVICSDDDALDFALAHRGELFAGVPLVFCGINDFQPSRIAGFKRVSGVTEEYDFAGSMEMVLGLHPGTRRLLVLADDTRSGKAARARLERAAGQVAGGVALEWLVSPSVAGAREALAALDAGTVVLYLGWQKAGDHHTLSLEQSWSIAASASPVPVYALWDYYPGSGVVGGRGMSAASQGKAAAGIALQFVEAPASQDVPLVEVAPEPYVFDYRAMERFDLSPSSLPAGAVVANRPETFYSRNWPWLWGILVFVLLEAALIGFYFVSVRKRRQLEQQLRHAQKMEAVGRLAGGVAHDFRNLLTVIDGQCALLESELAAQEDLRDRVVQVRDAAHRASNVASQLLAFSRKQVLQPRHANLNRVVGDLVDTVRHAVGEGIVVEWSLSEEVPSVFLDVQQLELAIINLGSNARDAMPEGGRLTVRTSREDLRDAAARSVGVPPGVYACLSVSDTGIGMDSRVRERLFEPFFTTKDPAHGTGLGLSMVHGFVEQSGGGIAVQSAAGRGSTFSLFFPAAGNAPVVTKPDSSQSGTSVRGGTETLLVVEDEQAVLDLMEEALLSFGYTVLTAPTPAQAIAVVAGLKQPPDLLVTDVLMPGMRGPELAARLRQMHPGLPVLYVSGHVLDSFDRGELEAIRSNFLEKPFTPRTLGRSVRRLLDARHPKV